MILRMLSAHWTAVLMGVLISTFLFVPVICEEHVAHESASNTKSSSASHETHSPVSENASVPDIAYTDSEQKTAGNETLLQNNSSVQNGHEVMSSFDTDEREKESSSNVTSQSESSPTSSSTTATKVFVETTQQQTNSAEPLKTASDVVDVSSTRKVVNDSHRYIVRAEPKIIGELKETDVVSDKHEPTSESPAVDFGSTEAESQKMSQEPSSPEDIPSFSEWAEKRLAEAEQTKGENGNVSSQGSQMRGGSAARLRSKNYASLDCGAKVVATNPEANYASSLLSASRDEYLLNVCGSRIWFVVELCEAIQAKKIEVANFELFSSSPKEFSAYVSDRFPSREWQSVGQFVAADDKTVQTFELSPQLFGKFIKIELHSHYGSEHYCPISLFRVYGTSEFEALETEDRALNVDSASEDDDDEDEKLDVIRGDHPGNLFGSARDAVLNMVKKAAEVLVNKGDNNNATEVQNTTTDLNISSSNEAVKTEHCSSPSHIIVCDNCSESMFDQVYSLLSCKDAYLVSLLQLPFFHKSIRDGDSCAEFGLDFANQRIGAPFPRNPKFCEQARFTGALFPRTYVAALCNILAVVDKKVVLNTTCHNCSVDAKTDIFPTIAPFEEIITSVESTCVVTERPNVSESHSDAFSENTIMTSPTEKKHKTLDIRPTKTLSKHEEESNTSVLTASQTTSSTESTPQPISSATFTSTASSKDVLSDFDKSDVMGDVSSEDSLDKLFSELLDSSSLPASSATASSPSPGLVQKESVFVRLSNRIKTLERNMSLSGQYLEELSRRYKKQMEEMQKSFNRTLAAIADESKKGEERDHRRSEELTALRHEVDNLSRIIEMLISERDSWQYRASTALQHLMFSAIEVCIFALVIVLCRRRKEDTTRDTMKTRVMRRRSVEGVSGHIYSRIRQRRPSEEALNILGTYNHLLINNPLPAGEMNIGTGFKLENKKKKKKKKDSLTKHVPADKKERRVSEVTGTCAAPESRDPEVRRASTSDTEVFHDNPHTCLPVEPSHIEELQAPVNGTSKYEDRCRAVSQRVSYPTFLKTAIASRNDRKSESSRQQPRLKSDNWEWYSSRRSPSIVENGHDDVGPVNGTDSSTNNDIFKKVAVKKVAKRFF